MSFRFMVKIIKIGLEILFYLASTCLSEHVEERFKDYYHFYEYFHGDSGKGLGAAHQTGWTGLVADLIQEVSEN
jgi:hypothetical protein